MNNLCEIIKNFGSIITAIGDERLTKQEIMDKNVPGINKNNITVIINRAVEDGLLIKDDKYYILNASMLSHPVSEFCDSLNILPSSATPTREAVPATPSDSTELIEYKMEVEGLNEQIDAYKSVNESLQEQVKQLQSEKEEMEKQIEDIAASDEGKNDTSETSPAFSSDALLASIDKKMDEKISSLSVSLLSAITSSSKNDTGAIEKIEKKEQEIAGYKDKVASLEKKIADLGTGNLAEIKKKWKEIKKALYGDQTVALPSGVVEALDERTGELVKKEGTVTAIPYFPDKPHACEANRPPFFSLPENMTIDGIYKDNVAKTQGIFSSMTSLHRKAMQAAPQEREKVMSDGKEQLVIELLSDPNKTDVQKISEYSVIRTLNGEYFHLLLDAVNNGLKAANIIAFLEEPTEMFNMEIVRGWCSLAMSEKNSDLRLEIARDLIDRKWSIRNGQDEYVLYSKKEIDEIKALLDKATEGNAVQGTGADSPMQGNAIQENETVEVPYDEEGQDEQPGDPFDDGDGNIYVDENPDGDSNEDNGDYDDNDDSDEEE